MPPLSPETHPKRSNNPSSTSSAPKPNATRLEARADSNPKSPLASHGLKSLLYPRQRSQRRPRAVWSARSPSQKVSSSTSLASQACLVCSCMLGALVAVRLFVAPAFHLPSSFRHVEWARDDPRCLLCAVDRQVRFHSVLPPFAKNLAFDA